MERVALLDFDNSLRPGFMVVDFGRYLARRLPRYQVVSRRVVGLVKSYEAGRFDYATLAHRVPKEFARGLAGIEVAAVKDLAARFVAADVGSPRAYPHMWQLLRELDRVGLTTIVVSGVPQLLLEALQPKLGFSKVFGIDLDVEGDRFTGRLLRNPATEGTKAEMVAELGAKYDCRLAIGDSRADAPLFAAAEFGIVIGSAPLSSSVETVRIDPVIGLTEASLARVRRVIERAAAQ